MFEFKEIVDQGKKALAVSKDGGKEKALYPYPPLNKPEILNLLKEDFDPKAASDQVITNLMYLAPDTLDWKEASKTLVFFCLNGEKSLADILKEAVAPDSPFTAEEAALCHWAQKILDTLAALKKKGLAPEAIASAKELQAYFN
ncbi:MAG: hypothetical protein LKF34_04245, partial [Acidaminococcaceae bacterium]|jgi:hypothetical protein|nr:hypothetical protein [Acidaminococcaceae bacterium]